MKNTQNSHGGARIGAGRPKGSTKTTSHQRPQRQLRAWSDEWELIKQFSNLVKHGDKQACIAFLSEFSPSAIAND